MIYGDLLNAFLNDSYKNILIGIACFPAVAIFGFVTLICFDNRFLVRSRLKNFKKFFSQEDLLKDGFSEKKLKASEAQRKYDAIFIGSGIGTLANAALLARRGLKVLCLEQHDVAGGCLHTFHEKGYEFDTGVHYVGGNLDDKKSRMRFLFDILSNNHLKWDKLDSVFDIAKISNIMRNDFEYEKNEVENNLEIHVPDNIITFESNLKKLFPSESENIEKFFTCVKGYEKVFPAITSLKIFPEFLLKRIGRKFRNLIAKTSKISTSQLLDSFFGKNSTALKGALTWCYGDYGAPPSESSSFLSAVMILHYCKGGAFYPRGGPENITRSLVSTIKCSGGDIFVRAPVSKIVLDETGTEAVGVEVRGVKIFASKIISGAGLINTYKRLITKEDAPNNSELHRIIDTIKLHSNPPSTVASVRPSMTAFTVFLGVKGDSAANNIPKCNYWLYPSWDHNLNYQKHLDSQGSGRYLFPGIFISSSSARDSTWAQRFPGKSVFEVICFADFDTFNKHETSKSRPQHRSDSYKQFKSLLEGRVLKVFKEQFPHLEDKIDFMTSGTPLTNNFYLGTVCGELYGLTHDSTRFSGELDHFLRPKQPIKGLYLTGQDVMTCGVVGAMMGGIISAVSIHPWVLVDIFTCYLMKSP